jgi:hypothetical protein
MRELARGEDVEPLEFRSTDFWLELADEFNAVRVRLRATAAAVEAGHRLDEPEAVTAA